MFIELTGRIRIGGDRKACAYNRIARHTVGRGAQGTGSVTVVDVAEQHRHHSVTATESVGHLHLRQVEVLRETTLCLQRQSILDKGGIGRIRRREAEEHIRTGCLLLVVGLGLFLLLPFQYLVFFGLVVLKEIAANGIRKILKLALIIARMSHQIDHHARRFLPTEVRVLKFCTADVCAKYREKHRDKGLVHVNRH